MLSALFLVVTFMHEARAVAPQPAEFSASLAWWENVFGPQSPTGRSPTLAVIFADVSDGLSRARSWRGTPFQLGDRTYPHGIAFNSTKHLRVQLPKPAARFTADIGLENNDDTQRGEQLGQGSVTFHVLVAGEEVYASPVLRRKDGARTIDLPLKGARAFEIRVRDGGDGRGWDQALWAEAVVAFEDGTQVRLQDIPFAGGKDANPEVWSFRYGGKNSPDLVRPWTRTLREQELDGQRVCRELVTQDPATGLEIRTEAIRFKDFPAVEWVVHLRNTSATNTPILEQIQALDTVLPLATSGNATLHWAKGGVASFDDFAPQTTSLKSGSKLRLQPGGGRSSSQVLPFFNVEGAGAGLIAAIGWSGEWAAEFACDAAGQVALKAGLDRTHLVLHPGESIRTPRMLLLFYEGDRWQGQNLLRRFILAHHRPKRGDDPLVAPITCGNWGGTRAEVHLDNIQKIIQHELPVEYYWIDAEWFGFAGWPVSVGNWNVKKDLYPQGFKPLSDALRKTRRELMLWFEPERVYRDSAWHKEHPEWMMETGGSSLLFNLGIPAARQFLTDFISDKVREFGLGCYRQDFNIDPLPFWRAADAPDRQGIAEIRYIEGLYAFWDGLLERHPNLILDNCASGGRRIDLETTGRATPFWRTDGPRDAIAHQCHSYGLLAWVPLSATSQDRALDDYEFRSSMCSALCLNWWVSGDVSAERIRPDFPFAWAKQVLDKYLDIRPFYYGDYYPLTSYSQARDVWMAWQFDRPESGDGMIVVLRRPDSPYESARIPLRALDKAARYRFTNQDTGAQGAFSGSDLISKGVPVTVTDRPGSAVFRYERTAE
ncbi:MAG: alpha-galactosidase [Verrucomicrobiia bacterium]